MPGDQLQVGVEWMPEIDLYFDTTLEGGTGETGIPVTLRTKMIYELVKIQPKLHAPPRVRFFWGVGLSFVAVV